MKWSHLKKNDIIQIFKQLHRKAEFIKAPFSVIKFMIIGKSIEDKIEIQSSLESNQQIFDLEDIIK